MDLCVVRVLGSRWAFVWHGWGERIGENELVNRGGKLG